MRRWLHTLRAHPWRTAAGALGLAAAAWLLRPDPQLTFKDAVMTPQLEPTTPICVGPVTLRVPSGFAPLEWSATIDGFKIERETNPSKDEQWFQSRLTLMERDWRELPHAKEGNRLKLVKNINGLGRALIHREDGRTTYTAILLARVRIGTQEFTLTKQTIDEYFDKDLQEVERIARNLRPYDPTTTPPKGGLCLDGAIYDGSFTEYFVSMDAKPTAYPGLNTGLTVTDAPSPPPPENGPIERAQKVQRNTRIAELLLKAGAKNEILHSQRRKTDLFDVEELVKLTDFSQTKDVQDRDVRKIVADADLYTGKTRPGFLANVWLISETTTATGSPLAGALPDDEALAMWQAVIRSVQPR